MKKKIQKSVVLVSGGMDSCVTATIAEKESNQMAFLHVNYGQRTERRELKAFEDIANFYDVKERFVLDLLPVSVSKSDGSE